MPCSAPIRSSGRRGATRVIGSFRSSPTRRRLRRPSPGSGAAAVNFEDQLAAEKKCGHLGGKVLVPTAQHIRTLLTSDIDPRDHPFISGSRTPEGYFMVAGALSPRSSARWPTLPTRISFGSNPLHPTSTTSIRPGTSPVRSTNAIRVSGSPITAHPPSIGAPTSMPSTLSSTRLGPWGTSSSSSRWPAGTFSISTASNSPMATPLAV